MAVPGAGMRRRPCRAVRSGSSWPHSGRPGRAGVAGSGGAVVLSQGAVRWSRAVRILPYRWCCWIIALPAVPGRRSRARRRLASAADGRPRGLWRGTKLAKE